MSDERRKDYPVIAQKIDEIEKQVHEIVAELRVVREDMAYLKDLIEAVRVLKWLSQAVKWLAGMLAAAALIYTSWKTGFKLR